MISKASRDARFVWIPTRECRFEQSQIGNLLNFGKKKKSNGMDNGESLLPMHKWKKKIFSLKLLKLPNIFTKINFDIVLSNIVMFYVLFFILFYFCVCVFLTIEVMRWVTTLQTNKGNLRWARCQILNHG